MTVRELERASVNTKENRTIRLSKPRGLRGSTFGPAGPGVSLRRVWLQSGSSLPFEEWLRREGKFPGLAGDSGVASASERADGS